MFEYQSDRSCSVSVWLIYCAAVRFEATDAIVLRPATQHALMSIRRFCAGSANIASLMQKASAVDTAVR